MLKVINEARDEDNTWLEDDMTRTIKKYKMFLDHINTPDSEWVHEYEETSAGRKVTLKPVYVNNLASPLLFKYAECVVMMSATILDVDVICRSLGLDRSHIAAIRMKNRFPVKNRQVYLDTVAKMTGGKTGMHQWGPDLVSGINRIVDKYPDKRGIIHTHNFAISDLLKDKCAPNVKSRFLFQKDFDNDKARMLLEHSKRPNSVLVAPAMHEGIDLRDDLSRFQIICKVPYANCFDNEQLARRVELDRKYYTWITAIKLLQSYGRSIRSETDYADTYILDESIYKFLKDAKAMIPSWFTEALVELQT